MTIKMIDIYLVALDIKYAKRQLEQNQYVMIQ
jgi:hypothetical protein